MRLMISDKWALYEGWCERLPYIEAGYDLSVIMLECDDA